MPEFLPDLILPPDFILMIVMLVGAALVAGFLAGLLGIGGGIVLTPVLFQIFIWADAPDAWRMHMAVATSLAIIAPTTLSAARAHARHGSVDWKIARLWLPMVALGAGTGAFVASGLSADVLVAAFACLAALMAVKMLLPLDHVRIGSELPRGVPGMPAPFTIGFLASMLGIGGSTFTVPYLTVYGTLMHRALGTAALVGSLVSVVGALSYMLAGLGAELGMRFMLGFVYLPAVLLVVPIAVMTAPLGARAAHKLNRRTLSVLFGGFLVLTSTRLFLSLF